MSDDKIVKALERAVAAVDQAKVPDDLRSDAFKLAWQEMSGQTEPPGTAGGLPNTSPPASAPAAEGAWAELAKRLTGVTVEQLQDIYELGEGGTFTPHLPTPALPRAKSDATRALALLIFAGRQYTDQEWTPGDLVIEVCKNYKKFDQANNASIMAEGDSHWRIEGKGKSKKYKLIRPGWEEAARLITRVTEG